MNNSSSHLRKSVILTLPSSLLMIGTSLCVPYTCDSQLDIHQNVWLLQVPCSHISYRLAAICYSITASSYLLTAKFLSMTSNSQFDVQNSRAEASWPQIADQ